MALYYFFKKIIVTSARTIARGCVWFFAARGCAFCVNQYHNVFFKCIYCRQGARSENICKHSVCRKYFKRRDY